MKILVIADPIIPIPPIEYGGAERIIAYLCAGLQRLGHQVDLMAAPGSQAFGGKLIVHQAPSLKIFSRACRKIWFQYLLARAVRRADVIVNFGRLDYLEWILAGSRPLVCCFQNPVDQSEVDWLMKRRRRNLALIGVSHSQIEGLKPEEFFSVVSNAANTEFFRYEELPKKEPYLAFLGRLTENKGVDTAIRVARRCGIKLKIAGNVSGEAGGKQFFEQRLQPEFKDGIEYLGPVNDVQKNILLGGARALLFPIRWKEPCAVTVFESLACGTPVIATRCASTPEVVEHGVTGFLCDNEDEMVSAVNGVDTLKRSDCRRAAEQKFSAEVMTSRYLEVIQRLLRA